MSQFPDSDSNISFLSEYEYMNPSYRSSMEDTVVIERALKDDPNLFFAALMDGHGGCATASFVASRLSNNVHLGLHQDEKLSLEQVMRFAFLYTDVECRMQKLMASGCTCASILIVRDPNTKEKTVVTANIGDSRIILSKRGSVTRLSYDHKAEDRDEILRIQSSGGMVLNKRVMGLLAVTRSFGDHSIKEFVIADPYLSSFSITPECEFIIMGCDGVFDVLSDEEVCAIVRECVQNNQREYSAQRIVEEAVKRDSRDNITAIVIGL